MTRDRTQDTRDIALPAVVQSWYFVCRSRELRRGRTLSWTLPGLPLVLYRGASGTAYALAAHCAHMGTHLVHGDVMEDRLRCPMHHWTYDGRGGCAAPQACRPVSALHHATFPVVERDGGVFVFVGSGASGETPAFALPTWIEDRDQRSADAGAWRVSIARPVRIATSWHACAINGFDVVHFETVHRRALREPAAVRSIDDHAMELQYVSRVLGRAPADRLMRWLARDRVKVTLTCWGGTVFVVRSEAGSFVNHLMLCLTPTETELIVRPIVAVPRTRVPGPDWLRGALTGWLFLSFLGRDLQPLSDMRLRAGAALDHGGPMASFVRWLAARPAIVPAAAIAPRAHRVPNR